ncbi:MAG: hypothetical protein PQJ49_07970 [Sphaerochaetaceae bacterium]|nr:hypothetical protein [Sphaerochaetaceae bacterium]
MKKLFEFLLGIGNFFLAAWVSYKVYGYFAPEVGFELPVLTYLNIIALSFVVSIFTAQTNTAIQIQLLFDKFLPKEERFAGMVYIKTLALLLIWFFGWIWYSILF